MAVAVESTMEEVSKMGDLAHQHTQDRRHDACHVNIASCCYSVCIHSNVKCFSSGYNLSQAHNGREGCMAGPGPRGTTIISPAGHAWHVCRIKVPCH